MLVVLEIHRGLICIGNIQNVHVVIGNIQDMNVVLEIYRVCMVY